MPYISHTLTCVLGTINVDVKTANMHHNTL